MPESSEGGGLEDDIFSLGEESGQEMERRPAIRDVHPRHRDRCGSASLAEPVKRLILSESQ